MNWKECGGQEDFLRPLIREVSSSVEAEMDERSGGERRATTPGYRRAITADAGNACRQVGVASSADHRRSDRI